MRKKGTDSQVKSSFFYCTKTPAVACLPSAHFVIKNVKMSLREGEYLIFIFRPTDLIGGKEVLFTALGKSINRYIFNNNKFCS
jgi:hypothetical protein